MPLQRPVGLFLTLVAAFLAAALLGGSTLFPAGAQTDPERFFSGPVIDGPYYCLNASFGGRITYAYDGDGDGIAETCSYSGSRRAAIARQNTFERLGSMFPSQLGYLFAKECLKVPASLGEPEAELTDECAAPRSAGSDNPPPVPPSPPPPSPADPERFFSGPVISGAAFCSNASLGGSVTYPYDRDDDAIADVCSLPRTRRAAAARQKALERLGEQLHPDLFNLLLDVECRKLLQTEGEAEAQDECSPPMTQVYAIAPSSNPAPGPSPTTSSSARPGEPTGLSVASRPEGTAASWTAAADSGGAPVTGYTVQWRTSAESWGDNSASTASTSYTFSHAIDCTARQVRVRATNSQGLEGEWSAIAETTLSAPGVPVLGEPTYPSSDQVRVEISYPNSGGCQVTAFEYELSIDTADFEDPIIGTEDTPNAPLAFRLDPGTYHVRIRAQNSLGTGPWSDTVTFTLR